MDNHALRQLFAASDSASRRRVEACRKAAALSTRLMCLEARLNEARRRAERACRRVD